MLAADIERNIDTNLSYTGVSSGDKSASDDCKFDRRLRHVSRRYPKSFRSWGEWLSVPLFNVSCMESIAWLMDSRSLGE